jgi:hypothetical protein
MVGGALTTRACYVEGTTSNETTNFTDEKTYKIFFDYKFRIYNLFILVVLKLKLAGNDRQSLRGAHLGFHCLRISCQRLDG